MPREECPECGAMVKVPDDFPSGNRMHCPECETAFVPSVRRADEEPPRRRQPSPSDGNLVDVEVADEDYRERPRRRKKGGNVVLAWVFGLVGVVVVAAVIVVIFVFARRTSINIDETFKITIDGKVKVIPAIGSERKIKVNATATGGSIDVGVYITDRVVATRST